MYMSKTPLRVSFFGGGTDYPAYLENNTGVVVGSTVNLYVYSFLTQIRNFAEFKYRILYRKNENKNRISDIEHPVIRAVLEDEKYLDSLNLSIMSDVPGGTGLGSSSSFTVGFINLIKNVSGIQLSRYDLAKAAIRVEHELLGENVGVQDQFHAAFGGLAKYEFQGQRCEISPIHISTECLAGLNKSWVLVYTGQQRSASKSLEKQIDNMKSRKIDTELNHLASLSRDSISVFESSDPEKMLRDLGAMLNESWMTKRSLSDSVSTSDIDNLYDTAKRMGVYGGKLCGAGAGGFFMFLAAPPVIKNMKEKFGRGNVIEISLDNSGSQVTTLGE